jgi:hypothetical protein
VLTTQYQLSYDLLYYCLCCNSHIINLLAQAFLFQTEIELVSSNNFETLSAFEVEQWLCCKPLSKLHNLVVYIQQSTQHIAQFQELSGSCNLSQDNSTR